MTPSWMTWYFLRGSPSFGFNHPFSLGGEIFLRLTSDPTRLRFFAFLTKRPLVIPGCYCLLGMWGWLCVCRLLSLGKVPSAAHLLPCPFHRCHDPPSPPTSLTSLACCAVWHCWVDHFGGQVSPVDFLSRRVTITKTKLAS